MLTELSDPSSLTIQQFQQQPSDSLNTQSSLAEQKSRMRAWLVAVACLLIVLLPGSGLLWLQTNNRATPITHVDTLIPAPPAKVTPVFSLSSLSPVEGGRDGDVTVHLKGSQLVNGAIAYIDNGVQMKRARQMSWRSVTSTAATFDLKKLPEGKYSITLVQNGESRRLADVFTIVPAQREDWLLTVRGPHEALFGQKGALHVDYSNPGNVDLPLVTVRVDAENAKLRENNNAAFSSAIYFFASGDAGSGLSPGEMHTLDLEYTITSASGSARFVAQVLTRDATVPVESPVLSASQLPALIAASAPKIVTPVETPPPSPPGAIPESILRNMTLSHVPTVQNLFEEYDSPLATYTIFFGGQRMSGAEVVVYASQAQDWGINPGLLLTYLEDVYGLLNAKTLTPAEIDSLVIANPNIPANLYEQLTWLANELHKGAPLPKAPGNATPSAKITQ